MNEIKGNLEPSPFLVVWKSGSWVMGVGSGEWGVGNEDEETGVSISLVSKVFNSIQKFHELQVSKRNLALM